MRRTQIYLSDEQVAALDRLAEASGLTKSQLVRDAIERSYLRRDRAALRRAVKRSAGAWKGRTETGSQYVDHLRPGRLARLHGITPD